jgi:hypothetical protein
MIIIKKSQTADTRTCDYAKVSKETLINSTIDHIEDVRDAMSYFGNMLLIASIKHDADKLSSIGQFHADFLTGFKEHSWWDNHKKITRHHLLDDAGLPADVNLVDVLEMICDCVMAGMARSGSVYPLNIKPEVLMNAFQNTVELLKANVKVED